VLEVLMSFEEIYASFQEAKKRLDEVIVQRARELYEDYDVYPEKDHMSWVGGVLTKAICRDAALHSLRHGKTVEEVKADWERHVHAMEAVKCSKP
jgi:hypothetical protein